MKRWTSMTVIVATLLVSPAAFAQISHMMDGGSMWGGGWMGGCGGYWWPVLLLVVVGAILWVVLRTRK